MPKLMTPSKKRTTVRKKKNATTVSKKVAGRMPNSARKDNMGSKVKKYLS